MAKSWKSYREDWLLFVEAGFIAVNQADENSAVQLFKAASLLKTESVLPQVGMGYLHLHKLELKQACKAFEAVLAKEPHNDMAKALLGICMSLAPNLLEKGEALLKQVHGSSDPLIKNLSDSALTFVDSFLKKSPAMPMGAPQKKEQRKQK